MITRLRMLSWDARNRAAIPAERAACLVCPFCRGNTRPGRTGP